MWILQEKHVILKVYQDRLTRAGEGCASADGPVAQQPDNAGRGGCAIAG